MTNGGECLCCERLDRCTKTSPAQVKNSYVCALFVPCAEHVYRARVDRMAKFGEAAAVRAMLPNYKEETR